MAVKISTFRILYAKKITRIVLIAAGLCIFSFIYARIPENIIMPVQNANQNSYDQNSFGAPRVGHRHQGVDIFARAGTPVLSATSGIVVYTGIFSLGGNVVVVLSPTLKFHYYAHLNEIQATTFQFVSSGKQIGTVGKTGNAKNTPTHLHYSISYFSPFLSYLDPVPQLNKHFGD